MYYTSITDQPEEKTEAANKFLADNCYQIAERALDIAAQNTDADGLIDALITEMALHNEPLRTQLEFVVQGGIDQVAYTFNKQIMEVARQFFTEKAEQELLREEELL